MPGCCAYGCTNKSSEGYRLFRLPQGPKNAERRKKWLHLISRANWKNTKNAKLCEAHFTSDDFERRTEDGRLLLNKHAVPSVFCHKEPLKKRNPSKYTNRDNMLSSYVRSVEDHNYAKKGSLQIFRSIENTEDFVNEVVIEDSQQAPMSSNQASNPDQFLNLRALEKISDTRSETNTEDPENRLQNISRDLSFAYVEDEPSERTFSPSIIDSRQCEGLGNMEYDLKRKLDHLQKKYNALQKQLQCLEKSVSSLFEEDQIAALKTGSCTGRKWSDQTVQKSLQLRLHCGYRGYEYLMKMGYPLPSERTLQRRLQNLKFNPGISAELFDILQTKIKTMKPEEVHAVLMMDEISLSPGLDYDISTGYLIGKPTLPSSNGKYEKLSSHALVFMLGGLTTRWKQTICYHFTGNSVCPKEMKKALFQAVVECEKVGFLVNVIVSDMGGQNLALWRACGIHSGRLLETKNWCEHPCSSSRRLYFMADVPHLLKNIRNHFIKGDIITLSSEIVVKYKLPTAIVSVSFVKQLLALDEKSELKLAPHLNRSCLEVDHYSKMKVGPACAVFSHSVGTALQYLVCEGAVEKDALTTAWFIHAISQWFYLMTSRSSASAISLRNMDAYNEAIEHLHKILYLFNNIEIGKKLMWKPVQTGVVLATTTALDLEDFYLNKMKFDYFCLGRLTQDALENLFSTVRLKNPSPHPKEFKMALRIITIAQYFKSGQNKNYFDDNDKQLLSVLEQNYTSGEENCEFSDDLLTADSEAFPDLCENEQQSLYYLCGCIIKKLWEKCKLCVSCKELLIDKHDDINEIKSFTIMKAYRQLDCLHFASDSVFQFLLKAEHLFRCTEEDLLSGKLSSTYIISYLKQQLPPNFLTCCDLHGKLLSSFVRHRIFFLVKKTKMEIVKNSSINYSSKSMGMRTVVSNSLAKKKL